VIQSANRQPTETKRQPTETKRQPTETKQDSAMPRYYFHLTDGTNVFDNHKGIDLAGNAAAREDALALARDLKHGKTMPGWNWAGWFVAIVDAHGKKIDEVPIAEA
jgi:hypothetical protein